MKLLHAIWKTCSLIAIGGFLAMPTMARAEDPFDINALPIDDENQFSNVGHSSWPWSTTAGTRSAVVRTVAGC